MKITDINFPGLRLSSLYKLLLVAVLIAVLPSVLLGQSVISGYVYHDENENGTFDTGEPAVQGIPVTNGRDITETNGDGLYEISAEKNSVVFVIKTNGWKTAVNKNNIPQFFAINSRDGAGGNDYQGLSPSEELSEQVNFPLYKMDEPDSFRVLMFGDTQPRTIEEVNYIAHDSVQEVIGVDAAFGATLGDLVFDDLNLFEPLNQVIGQIGLPWRHVMGNHDIDFSADDNWNARGAYLRTYGPSWYAFQYGKAHFIVMDNIRWIVEENDRYYRTGLGEKQMQFVENYLKTVPDDELVVFMAHIPWVGSTPWADDQERRDFFNLIVSHQKSISFVAHTHRHYHHLIGDEEGFPGDDPHHMVSMATVCGSWWTGAHDEYGIPHSMMRDGTPTGYGFLEIDGADWKFSFKAARRPADFQMHVYAPDEIMASETSTAEVYANVFNALPDATVEMKIGQNREWMAMSKSQEPDPFYVAMKEREDALDDLSWRRTGDANTTPHHLWKSKLPEDLDPGTYTVYIRSNDRWHNLEGKRIIRVIE